MRTRTIALLSAGILTVGGLTAACATVDNEPQAKRTVTESPAAAPKNATPKKATPKKATPKPPSAPTESVSEANARASAENYLSFKAFSRKGLIEQLTSEYGEGFSMADATYGVDAAHADWNEQAAKSAKDYLGFSSFSRSGLIDQLSSEYGEQFTRAQAEYGVGTTGL